MVTTWPHKWCKLAFVFINVYLPAIAGTACSSSAFEVWLGLLNGQLQCRGGKDPIKKATGLFQTSGFFVCSLSSYLLTLVPKRGLEPPRLAALVPETSASTNSATWASQERREYITQSIKQYE